MHLQAPTHEYTWVHTHTRFKKINLPKICCSKMKTTIATKATVRHEGEFVCVLVYVYMYEDIWCSVLSHISLRQALLLWWFE